MSSPSARPRLARRIAGALVGLVGLVALFAVTERDGHAEAKKRTSTLGWLRLAGADSCVATQPLARAVEARLGRTVFVSPADADVSVEGRIERKGNGFSATILLRDAEGKTLGTRSLEKADASCASLTESIVLVIAVMIDPDAALGAPAPPPAPPAPAAPSPPPPPEVRVERVYVPVPVPGPAPPPAPPSPPALLLDGAVSGRLAVGVVPEVGLGLATVGVLVPRGFIGVLVRASFLFPRVAPVEGAEVSFAHGSVGSGLCPLSHAFGRVFLSACAEGELGLLLARPSGLPRAVNEARVTLAGGTSFGASILVVGPLTVRAGVLGQLPLIRESFQVTLANGQNYEVFRQAPVTFSADLGVGLRFP